MTGKNGIKISIKLETKNLKKFMADEFVPYIKYDAKAGGYYPTIDFRSLPFPPSNIPDLFNGGFKHEVQL